ncbi:hypothetical protein [Halostella litorea]|uniref:hypothetical protein n=1 Tax=Halostella litorea TaxID=2528831 RepID=UPI0013872867|nr:hypothetical protein [Halostella litorea]
MATIDRPGTRREERGGPVVAGNERFGKAARWELAQTVPVLAIMMVGIRRRI